MQSEPPFDQLFQMFKTHCGLQLKLSSHLLDLRAAEQGRDRYDKKLQGDELTAEQRTSAEESFGKLDDQVLEIRGQIREIVEKLIGVSYAHIEEANL